MSGDVKGHGFGILVCFFAETIPKLDGLVNVFFKAHPEICRDG